MRSVRLLVFGFVQGVGFRYATREAAQARGVTGWVRNLPDGSVEIVAQGGAEAVAAMTAWVEHGPPYARVERVVRETRSSGPDLAGFEIRR